jgi:NAD(P)-dependent dehydrogenase (short-subunit alcohol dehydrogenase family)
VKLFDLKGKTAIVTGSSRGIGRAIAEQLAQFGARVVISSRKAGPCEEVAAAIKQAGGDAVAIPCNIGIKEQLQNLVDKTHEAFGPIDILVCNAASNPYYGSLAKIPEEAFDKVMHNNIKSNLWLSTMAMPDMVAKKDGAIIIISSIGGLRGSTDLGAYAISKAADMQLARNLACEWGPHNIRVNCIAPGLIRTDFAKALWENPEILKATTEQAPLRRIGEPEEIAGIAVLLASRAGAFITGTTIVADGGVTISGRG